MICVYMSVYVFMHYDQSLVGPDWFNSYEKRAFEADIVEGMRPAVSQLVAIAAQVSYDCYGYMPFFQMRVGQGGTIRPVPKLQTLTSTVEPWRDSDNNVDLSMKFIRDMGIDELLQALRISNNPNRPSDTALFGFRSLLPENVENLGKRAVQHGYLDLFEEWQPKFEAVPSALYDVSSLLDDSYEPGTIEYDIAKMKLQCAYHDTASFSVDSTLFGYIIIGGAKRLAKHGLLKPVDPRNSRKFPYPLRAICTSSSLSTSSR